MCGGSFEVPLARSFEMPRAGRGSGQVMRAGSATSVQEDHRIYLTTPIFGTERH
jgi:hypothetical protein